MKSLLRVFPNCRAGCVWVMSLGPERAKRCSSQQVLDTLPANRCLGYQPVGTEQSTRYGTRVIKMGVGAAGSSSGGSRAKDSALSRHRGGCDGECGGMKLSPAREGKDSAELGRIHRLSKSGLWWQQHSCSRGRAPTRNAPSLSPHYLSDSRQ